MRLGIDGSNLRLGGGITHLTELLRAAEPLRQGFSEVVVWAGAATLREIPDRPWLVKSSPRGIETSGVARWLWQSFGLARAARTSRCDILFVPGGSYMGSFRPFVTMSRNMQPFEPRELRRHGWSRTAARLVLLRQLQARSFQRADGLIFLTRYARNAITPLLGRVPQRTTIIPHGVDQCFKRAPAEQLAPDGYTSERPFRILYVSIVNVYKHQWHVAEAVARLRAEGFPVSLELVGPGTRRPLERLEKTLRSVDPRGECIRYLGPAARSALPGLYARADLCLFASSCENMPNILLEGMASGLPVACSNRGPMPEILGSAGVYFDPESPDDIARAVRRLLESKELRAHLAEASFARAQSYSCQRCATETLQFIAEVAQRASTSETALSRGG